MIFGSLLGDLCITRPKRSPRLSFTHGIAQRPYALHKMDVLKRLSWWHEVSPASGYAPGNLGIRGSSSCLPVLENVWTKVRSQGVKEPTPEWLAELDDRSLAYWFMDDGSVNRSKTTGAISEALLHTQGFTQESNELLAEWLRGFGFPGVRVAQYGARPCLYIPRVAVEVFFARIRPYIHDSMRYKTDGTFTK